MSNDVKHCCRPISFYLSLTRARAHRMHTNALVFWCPAGPGNNADAGKLRFANVGETAVGFKCEDRKANSVKEAAQWCNADMGCKYLISTTTYSTTIPRQRFVEWQACRSMDLMDVHVVSPIPLGVPAVNEFKIKIDQSGYDVVANGTCPSSSSELSGSKESCMTAAAAFGRDFAGESTCNGDDCAPPGCYVDVGDGKLYWNSDRKGACSHTQRCICLVPGYHLVPNSGSCAESGLAPIADRSECAVAAASVTGFT